MAKSVDPYQKPHRKYAFNDSENRVGQYNVEHHLGLSAIQMFLLEILMHIVHENLHYVPTWHKDYHKSEAEIHSCIYDVVHPQVNQSEDSKHGIKDDHSQNHVDRFTNHYNLN